MKIRLLFTLFFLMIFSTVFSTVRISVLSSTPSDDEIYTVWGHTAIRVKSEITDEVFNYGVFEFGDNFMYNFVKGNTDYWVEQVPTMYALAEAYYKNVDMYEQVLDLTQEEARAVRDALHENALPKNRVYRYNFFFDNCATRPRNLIEKTIGGIVYPEVNNTTTYRDQIHHLTRGIPWLTFGIDLCLGSPTDKVIEDYDLLFLPMELKKSYSGACRMKDGKKLVKEEQLLVKEVVKEKEGGLFPSPVIFFSLLFVFAMALTVVQMKKGSENCAFDCVFFTVLGLVGLLLFFLSFISTHPCVWPNYNLLWANPLHLLLPVALLVRKANVMLKGLLAMNLLFSSIVVLGWFLLPQVFHWADLPIIFVSIGRSVFLWVKRM